MVLFFGDLLSYYIQTLWNIIFVALVFINFITKLHNFLVDYM